MIHHCENCINRNNCPENQKQYKALCKKIKKLIKKKKYHCYYSLHLKCDYWIADKNETLFVGIPNTKE